MKLFHIVLVLGLFIVHAFAMVSQNDIPKDVIGKANVDSKEDNEIGEEEIEEETKGDFGDETGKNEKLSDEDIDIEKEVKALYNIAKDQDKFDKDMEKAAMDVPFFAPPQDENETDEDETETDEDTPTGRFDDATVSKTGGVCKNKKSEAYCLRKASTGQCKHKKVRDECKQACLVCCADSYSTDICQNVRFVCNARDTKDRMRSYCPKTCGFCGEAIKPPACSKTRFGCCWDRKTTKTKFMAAGADGIELKGESDNCPKCVDKQREQFCRQFEVDCTDYERPQGRQIRAYCPKTCRLCTGSDGVPPRCMDDPKHEFFCPQYKDEGWCKRDKKNMKFLCSKTCGFCKPLNDHQHAAPRCSFLAEKNACQKYSKEMKTLCAFTCKFSNYPSRPGLW